MVFGSPFLSFSTKKIRLSRGVPAENKKKFSLIFSLKEKKENILKCELTKSKAFVSVKSFGIQSE
jgi:hypothetical protein